MSKNPTGLKRDSIDKFYTSPTAVKECISLVKKHIVIQENDLCIEPSAGNGSFIDEIKKLSKKYVFYDVKPEHNEIITQDYLELDYALLVKSNKKIHVIGNPPFGRQSSLAIKFIKKSCEYCDSVSFILPKSFKKDSLKAHFPPNFHLIYEYELPEYSFYINKKEHNVPCVFQIWLKKTQCRPVPVKLAPSNYKFVKKTDVHDISFRRVGIKAGEIDRETSNKSTQSHYFIKFKVNMTDELLHQLKSITYDCKDDTCGPRSISKQELIREFNKLV